MLPVVAVLAAALCFATTGTALALADVDGSPVSVGAARVLVGGGILGIIALVHRAMARGEAPRRMLRADPRSRVPAWVIVLVGAVGVLAYQPAFFAGTRMNGVAIGTVVALGSAPIATGVLDALIRRRRPSIRWFVATAIALVGVVLVSGMVSGTGTGTGTGTDTMINPLGLLASFGAGASYALYTIASKLLLDRGWETTSTMGGIFGCAAVLSVPLLLGTSPFGSSAAWLLTPEGIVLALWLGVVTTAVAYLLFGWGLRRLSPTTVATLTLAEPLGATLLGILVLHEQLSPMATVGIVVIAAGLTVLSLPGRAQTPSSASGFQTPGRSSAP